MHCSAVLQECPQAKTGPAESEAGWCVQCQLAEAESLFGAQNGSGRIQHSSDLLMESRRGQAIKHLPTRVRCIALQLHTRGEMVRAR